MTRSYEQPDGHVSSADIGRVLAENDIIDAACDTLPFLSGEYGGSHASTPPIEYLLSEQSRGGHDWLTSPWYERLVAKAVSQVIICPTARQPECSVQTRLIETASDLSMAPVPAPATEALERHIAQQASGDALNRVGWLKDGKVLSEVLAMYHYHRADIRQADDCEMAQRAAAIERAHVSYGHHAQRLARPGGYIGLANSGHLQTIEFDDQLSTPIAHWWRMVTSDLQRFRNSVI